MKGFMMFQIPQVNYDLWGPADMYGEVYGTDRLVLEMAISKVCWILAHRSRT